MLLRRVPTDHHTFPRVLTACRLSRNLSFARQVHGTAVKLGFSSDHYVVSALIHMYGCLHNVGTAKRLFDKTSCRNSVSWTLLAKLYIMENKPGLAIDLFYQMVDFNSPDHVALATAISACTMLKSLQQGRKVHEIAMKYGLDSNILVSNSLLKMYIDCERIEDAREVFNRMVSKDIISWTEMIRGNVKKGRFNEGLKLLRQMNGDGIRPDSRSVSTVLPTCARMAAHKQGKEIHAYLLRNRIDLNITLQNAVMDMYVKSGSIELASRVFTGMKERDVVSWTVMTIGYSLHGQGELAVESFQKMEEELRIEIDQFPEAAALLACNAALMVDKGRLYFDRIKEPKVGHYALMVSLLARAGLFDEARIFIEEQGIERQAEVLKALLDGCRIHQQGKLGKQVINQLCNLEPLNADNYILLSNWYANNDKWDKVDEIQQSIRDMGLKPKKAYSWIELKNKVHVFGTGDVSHPRSERIYWELKCLMNEMEGKGYKPITAFNLHDVDEERECIQIGHSELLAISFGLISTQTGTTIRVTKNLNVCCSCHDFSKFISKMVNREIVLKDPNRFHHFKNGSCSCRDFW